MDTKDLENLKGSLNGLTDKAEKKSEPTTEVPPAPTGVPAGVAPTEKPTTEFNGKKEKDPEKAQMAAIRTAALSNIAATLQQKREGALSFGKKLLIQAMSKHAYIAGYVTNFNEKVDFASKKEKAVEGGPETYNIRLRMAPPSSIRAVIIMEPVDVLAFFEDNRYDLPESAAKIQAICDKPFGDPSITYTPYVCPWAEITNYLLSKTNGRLNEHPEIVEQYIKKGPKTQAKVWNANNDESYLVASVRYVADSGAKAAIGAIKVPKVCTKHSYRSRIVTPHNFVALKKYQTYVPGSTPTLPDKETAKAQIKAYLGRFTKENTSKQVPMGHLSVECSRNFTVSDGGKTVDGSAYFAVAGEASWFANASNAIDHWYSKDQEGRAVQIPAAKIELVVKEEKETSSGKTRIVTAYDELGSATSSSKHKFDKNEYETILKLTRDSVSVDKLNVKTAVVKNGKAVVKVSSEFRGDTLAGLSAEEIATILMDANGTARKSAGV